MKKMEDSCIMPQDVGIRVRRHPKASFLQLTAKNKQQDAIVVESSFNGVATQTTSFVDDDDVIEHNFIKTNEFIKSLGKPIDISTRIKSKNSILIFLRYFI